MIYYVLLGPRQIEHPDMPPEKTWVEGMDRWAKNATVRFVEFTTPRAIKGIYGATVEIIELDPNRTAQPVHCPKRLVVPYVWLQPFPNYHVFDNAPGHAYMGFDKNTKIEVI
jgi:hypothetical protein